jgi:hypothetical protein
MFVTASFVLSLQGLLRHEINSQSVNSSESMLCFLGKNFFEAAGTMQLPLPSVHVYSATLTYSRKEPRQHHMGIELQKNTIATSNDETMDSYSH